MDIEEIRKSIYTKIFEDIFNRELGFIKRLEYSDILKVINEVDLDKYKEKENPYKKILDELKSKAHHNKLLNNNLFHSLLEDDNLCERPVISVNAIEELEKKYLGEVE